MKLNIIFAIIIFLFIGCGENPINPVPTFSEDEMGITRDGKNILDDNITAEILENNISISETNISAIDENGTLIADEVIESSSNTSATLIEEDVDYINTQFESIYFDYDRYTIKESMLPIVTKNIKLMNAPQVVGNLIIIEGNCDEWGTDEYNYALGLKRAQIIKETFISEGMNQERVKIVTFGESNPICLEQIDECWAKNRRVDFKLEK